MTPTTRSASNKRLKVDASNTASNTATATAAATAATSESSYAYPYQNVPTLSLSKPGEEQVAMPQIGFGTYKFKKGSGDAEKAVLEALKVGYRHIDTAFIYGGEQTEREVGNALKKSAMAQNGPSRSELFITTKQWRAYHGYERTKECLGKSLKRLQLDYVDLYLMHWPGPNNYKSDDAASTLSNIEHLRAESWRAMEDSHDEGKCKAIGVSNFSIKHLESLRKTARIWPPAVNQIELHPYNPQTELVQYCQRHGIVVQAYASLGGQDSGKKTWKTLGGKLVERDEVKSIAQKYNKTEAQVLLRWAAQQQFGVIPKSSKVEHMHQNLQAVTSWQGEGLDASDLELLASLDLSKSTDDDVKERLRLCWVRDPLKMLEFD
jgi:diketogulonate reductase-like aldo/keto reductase